MFSMMLFASRASGLCKHGLGNLSRLNVETLESTLLFGKIEGSPPVGSPPRDYSIWKYMGYVEVLFIRKLIK